MPRTILGPTDGNKCFNHELSPYERGKIVGAVSQGASFTDAGKLVHRPGSTARATVKHDAERLDGHTRPRTGRPKSWDDRFERRVLRQARINPKMSYREMQDALNTILSFDTLYRILKSNGIINWLAKKRPYLTEAAAKMRHRWCIHHANWSVEQWATIIWSDECSVERGAGKRMEWVFRTPAQNWDKEMIQTYHNGKDISIMVWGAIWIGGRSELFIMERDEESKRGGYSARSYLQVLEDQLPTIWSSGMTFMRDNASIHNAHVAKDWFANNGIPVMDWPPDLNPIEMVWGWLKDWITTNHPELIDMGDNEDAYQALYAAIKEGWESIPQEKIDNLIKGYG
jgi:hypothetical protein